MADKFCFLDWTVGVCQSFVHSYLIVAIETHSAVRFRNDYKVRVLVVCFKNDYKGRVPVVCFSNEYKERVPVVCKGRRYAKPRKGVGGRKRKPASPNPNEMSKDESTLRPEMSTQSQSSSSKKINIDKLVYGLRSIGKGMAAGKMLCGVMNLPQPPTKPFRYNKFLKDKAKQVMDES
ncbi:hypothetical protein J6590_029197 [Homalodisca vitripennis]|nr:hypothetical protein J6590_029197 [Homalodisca vitripennis]